MRSLPGRPHGAAQPNTAHTGPEHWPLPAAPADERRSRAGRFSPPGAQSWGRKARRLQPAPAVWDGIGTGALHPGSGWWAPLAPSAGG